MIYLSKPPNFSPKFEVVGCFVEYNGEIVLLHRCSDKSEGNTWGMPAGKLKSGESPLLAARREVSEEIGHLAELNHFSHFLRVYVRYSDYDFIYHIFHLPIPAKLEVTIDPEEHQDFVWIKPKEALTKLPLIQDLDNCIRLFYQDTQ